MYAYRVTLHEFTPEELLHIHKHYTCLVIYIHMLLSVCVLHWFMVHKYIEICIVCLVRMHTSLVAHTSMNM